MSDTEGLQKELQLLKKDYEEASQQRILIQQKRDDVAEVMVVLPVFCWYVLLPGMEIPGNKGRPKLWWSNTE